MLPPPQKKWNAAVLCFPLEFVCGSHNEKYACILCSFVFKSFRAGMHKDLMTQEFKEYTSFDSEKSWHREGAVV